MRSVTAWMWGLAAVPAAWLVLFALFIVRARLSLGRWPLPYDPDPKDLGFDFHYAALIGGPPMMFAAVLGVLVLTMLTYRHARPPLGAPTLAILSLVVLLLLANADPGFLFTWLGD